MKRIAVSVLALALSAAAGSSAFAAQDYGRYDNNRNSSPRSDVAQVIRVEQLGGAVASYQRQECWDERTSRYEDGYYRDANGRLYRGGDNGTGGTVLGAIIGGALGNQVGKGDGRKAATIGGAVIGGIVGNNIDRNNDGGYDQYRDNSGVVRRCRTVTDYDDRGYNGRGGYNVTYRYAGQTYQAVMDHRPGRTMRVVVDVRPADNGVAYRRR